jgi:CBS domain-containing protein
MRVADLMQTDVRTVIPETTVAEAIAAFSDSHVSGLPVVDQHGRLLGVVSTSDVMDVEAEAGAAARRATVAEELLVTDIMTPRPLTCTPETDLREAARQMLYADVKRLFVERDGELVGVVSQTDIVRAVANGRL